MTPSIDEAAAQRLREHELIFERAHTGILFVRERVILRCNPQFEAMFGHPRGELIGKSTRVLFADEQAWAAHGARVYPVLAEAGVFDEVSDHVRRDGSPICCHVIGSQIEAGNPAAGSVWLFEDITAPRGGGCADPECPRARADFRQCADRHCLHEQPDLPSLQQAFEEIFGLEADAVIGKTTRACSPAMRPSTNSVAACRMPRRQAGVLGRSLYRRQDNGESIWVRVDGKPIPEGDGRSGSGPCRMSRAPSGRGCLAPEPQ